MSFKFTVPADMVGVTHKKLDEYVITFDSEIDEYSLYTLQKVFAAAHRMYTPVTVEGQVAKFISELF